MKKTTDKYVLSICIPTFNRSKELITTLKSIVAQEGFDASVEIVVADNASTDETQKQVEQFQKKHKNVLYFRNKENLGPDKNILRAAELGRGRYIKLLNDNKSFAKGALKRMKAVFADANESVVFFKNSGDFAVTRVGSVDGFLSDVSFFCTWLGGISYKRSEMARIDLKKIKKYPFFSQTELMFALLRKRQSALVVSGQYFHEPNFPVRAGYNYFEVFGQNYVRLLTDLRDDNFITGNTLGKMKKDVLLHHIFPFSFDFLFRPGKTKLKTGNSIGYLFRNFKDQPWLYLFPVWVLLKVSKATLRKLGRLGHGSV